MVSKPRGCVRYKVRAQKEYAVRSTAQQRGHAILHCSTKLGCNHLAHTHYIKRTKEHTYNNHFLTTQSIISFNYNPIAPDNACYLTPLLSVRCLSERSLSLAVLLLL